MGHRRKSGAVHMSRLPKGIRQAAARRIEKLQQRGPTLDPMFTPEKALAKARQREVLLHYLEEGTGLLGPRVERLANVCRVTSRTIRRWLSRYRDNPGVSVLVPHYRGPPIGHRRLSISQENLVTDVVDVWAARTERLPISWIVEECARRCKAAGLPVPSRGAVVARLRDRGISTLRDGRDVTPPPGVPRSPRPTRPLEIVQIDHTLVDIMVVDEVQRESMGRPWVTVAFDVATRVVLGFLLSLNPPSATSVGLALAMAGLPKDQWLKEQGLKVRWAPYGIPKVLRLDNAAEFHSVALKRGCERYGIRLEYRPPGRPQYGGHIERYLGTLMRRIHGLPGTTMSNPVQRGKYPSEAKASMTMAELGQWMALEIAGRYHHQVHRGLHAVPAQVWDRAIKHQRRAVIDDPTRFTIDFLPAEMRRITKNGFQLSLIRYWDPLLNQMFPVGTRILVRYDPRDLSKVFVPSTDRSGYLDVPYADLRRPPITRAELERARSILTRKGERHPTEDQIFATTAAQRRIEDASRQRTRSARRNAERRPGTANPAKTSRPKATVDYSRPAIPYKGEEW
jgi:putative transposase